MQGRPSAFNLPSHASATRRSGPGTGDRETPGGVCGRPGGTANIQKHRFQRPSAACNRVDGDENGARAITVNDNLIRIHHARGAKANIEGDVAARAIEVALDCGLIVGIVVGQVQSAG